MKIFLSLILLLFPNYAFSYTSEILVVKNSDFTQGNIQMKLKIGETLKSDVLEDFGAPNITTRDGSGFEVWTYQRSSQLFEQKKDDQGFWLLLFSNNNTKNKSSSSSKMTTIIMKFDENDKLYDYRSRTSNF